MKQNLTLTILRIIALIIGISGAMGSIGLMLYSGRHNPSVLLILLFVCWVLSPFVVLVVANILSNRWPVLTSITLYMLTIVITPGSLLCYTGVISISGTKPAFKYLIVPLVSWLLIVIVITIAKSLSRKNNNI